MKRYSLVLNVNHLGKDKIKKSIEKSLGQYLQPGKKREISKNTMATLERLLDNDSFLSDLAETVSISYAIQKQGLDKSGKKDVKDSLDDLLKATHGLLVKLRSIDALTHEHYILSCVADGERKEAADLPFQLAEKLGNFQTALLYSLKSLDGKNYRKRTKEWQVDLAGNIARILKKHGVIPRISKFGPWSLLTAAFTEGKDPRNLLRAVSKTERFKSL